MPPAVWIARLVGPLFAAIGLGILLNAEFYAGAVVEAVHSPTLVYLSGIASLLAGLAIVNAYRTWSADWRVVVTVIGWLCIIGGIVRIVLPGIVGTLATRLGIPEYRLRRLINQRLGYRNFNVFLNEHRIAEAKAALADPSQAEVPVITIAMDAGFQSLGPFNRAFKATTGVTPTEYRRLKASAA